MSTKTIFDNLDLEKAPMIKEVEIKKEKDFPRIVDDEVPLGLPCEWEWIWRLGNEKRFTANAVNPLKFWSG